MLLAGVTQLILTFRHSVKETYGGIFIPASFVEILKCTECGYTAIGGEVLKHFRKEHLPFYQHSCYCIQCQIGFVSGKLLKKHASGAAHKRKNKAGLPEEGLCVYKNLARKEITVGNTGSDLIILSAEQTREELFGRIGDVIEVESEAEDEKKKELEEKKRE